MPSLSTRAEAASSPLSAPKTLVARRPAPLELVGRRSIKGDCHALAEHPVTRVIGGGSGHADRGYGSGSTGAGLAVAGVGGQRRAVDVDGARSGSAGWCGGGVLER
ncbi:hypothetical protein GCM10010185_25890 [Saccharothrix coeruleofusca]|uniref:Uncharacterized protein n=1 Tax=Saccharothrix coeruleofusca TaxID=33919 RepID=A0A918EDP8_9PSEU|nr:hypothetical protein GCM10010185_25890 [Saccharothrix coeruleofusca]